MIEPLSRRARAQRPSDPAGSGSRIRSGNLRRTVSSRHLLRTRASRAPSARRVRTSTSLWPVSCPAPGRVGAPGDRVAEVAPAVTGARNSIGSRVGDHLELQRPHRGQHRSLVAAQVGGQDLDHALAVELLDAAAELLERARVGAADHREVLGGEARDGRERDGIGGVERVAGPQRTRVDQADDVAGERLLDGGALLAEHRLGVLRGERAPGGGVGEHHAALEAARADPHERHPVAVRAVHARLHLEHQPGQRRVQRARLALGVAPGLGCGGELDQRVEQPRDADPVSAAPNSTGVADAR